MSSENTFYSWLSKQQKRRDPVGELARDIQRDPRFPDGENNLESLHSHLVHSNACREAIFALHEAHREFLSPKRLRGSLSLKVRFLVFKRDDYRCQICGATPETGARLEVDHKHPVSKGGSNELENLWSLCFECNRGKGTHEI